MVAFDLRNSKLVDWTLLQYHCSINVIVDASNALTVSMCQSNSAIDAVDDGMIVDYLHCVLDSYDYFAYNCRLTSMVAVSNDRPN